MVGAPRPDLLHLPSPPPPQVQELQDSLLRLESFPPPSPGQAGGSGSGSSSSGVDEEPWGTQVSTGSLKTTILRFRILGDETQILVLQSGSFRDWKRFKPMTLGSSVTIWANQVTFFWQDPFSLAHPLLRRLRSDSSTQMLGPLPTQPPAPGIHVMEAQMEQLQA